MSRLLFVAALVTAIPLFSGCGKNEGANTPTTVTYRGDDAADDNPTPGPGPGTPGDVKFGSFKGRVVFDSTPDPLPLLVRKGDTTVKNPDVCAAHDIPNERLIVSADGGVKNVFIFLEDNPKGAPKTPVPSKAFEFDQKGCKFIPHAKILRTNQVVKILSDDSIAHNTRAKPGRGRGFNEVIPANDRTGRITMKYNRSQKIPTQVKCDYHGWMRAYHLALDHPYAALTDDQGRFEIKGLPVGTHRFKVWHEGVQKAGFLNLSFVVQINADSTTEKDIPYPAAKLKGL